MGNEFLEARPRVNGRCWACMLPEEIQQKMEEAHKAGVGPTLIVRTLITRFCYSPQEVTKGRVQHHLYNHVGDQRG